MSLEAKPQRNDVRTMRFVACSLRTRCRREDRYRNVPSLQSSVDCVDAASCQQKNVSQQRFVVSSRWDLFSERTTSPGFRLTPPPGATDVTPALRAGNLCGVVALHRAGWLPDGFGFRVSFGVLQSPTPSFGTGWGTRPTEKRESTEIRRSVPLGLVFREDHVPRVPADASTRG